MFGAESARACCSFQPVCYEVVPVNRSACYRCAYPCYASRCGYGLWAFASSRALTRERVTRIRLAPPRREGHPAASAKTILRTSSGRCVLSGSSCRMRVKRFGANQGLYALSLVVRGRPYGPSRATSGKPYGSRTHLRRLKVSWPHRKPNGSICAGNPTGLPHRQAAMKNCRWRPASSTSNSEAKIACLVRKGLYPRLPCGNCGSRRARLLRLRLEVGRVQNDNWCTSQVSSLALLFFKQALSPDQLEVRCVWRHAGVSIPSPSDRQSDALPTELARPGLVGTAGLEPATLRLKAGYSCH